MRDVVVTFLTQTVGLMDPIFWIVMACAFGLGRARQSPLTVFALAFGMALFVILVNWTMWQKFYGDQASSTAMQVLMVILFVRGPVLLGCWAVGQFTSIRR